MESAELNIRECEFEDVALNGNYQKKGQYIILFDGRIEIVEYSNKEHIHETKSKIYNNKKLEERKKEIIKVGDKLKSVEQIESELSNYNPNSCRWGKCVAHITVKNRINNILIEHYEQYIYRKYKWYTYINQQKAEQKMLKRFKEKMGESKESAIL